MFEGKMEVRGCACTFRLPNAQMVLQDLLVVIEATGKCFGQNGIRRPRRRFDPGQAVGYSRTTGEWAREPAPRLLSCGILSLG